MLKNYWQYHSIDNNFLILAFYIKNTSENWQIYLKTYLMTGLLHPFKQRTYFLITKSNFLAIFQFFSFSEIYT